MRLVKRDLKELKRFRDWLLSAQAGSIVSVRVSHYGNRRCCRRERWAVTARRLAEGIRPPTPTIMLNMGGVP
jgi:hypothetical protein